jgi:hypothetical protein
VLLDQIFELIDVPLFLRFCAPPELLDIWPAAGIGDVLVESPQAVQPPAQIVDQVVIVIFDSAGFTEVFVFLVRAHRHRVARFIESTQRKKKRRGGMPKGFHHVGLLFNEPPGRRQVALYLVIRLTQSVECLDYSAWSKAIQVRCALVSSLM